LSYFFLFSNFLLIYRAKEFKNSAYFAVYVAKNENDRILRKMKMNLIDLPKVYYFNPRKSYSHHNEYELIEENQELRHKCQSLTTHKK
jgi:hypothetical protein